MRTWSWAALMMLLAVSVVMAQSEPTSPVEPPSLGSGGTGTAGPVVGAVPGELVAGVTYVDAGALAIAVGDVVTATGGVLTWRGAQGVATFFLDSADALLQQPLAGGPDDWALAAPPQLRLGGRADQASDWLLPLDAVQLLGMAASWLGDHVYLHLPDGTTLPVTLRSGSAPGEHADPVAVAAGSSELTTVAGVPALRFFVDDELSLLLLDLDLAPLAYPELTAVVDDAAARAGGDQALLAVVTSLGQRDWPKSLVFEQDDLSIEVRSPYRFHLYLGEDTMVAPGAPVAGVILLPPSFSLYKPIAVSWAGQTATVTFRR